jgi:protein SSD1
LRPSSQATKEKQEAERQAREGANSRPQQDRQQDKPKIVWFKPTDKRVPLIAIPTEQAPRDFVENHQAYQNKIFVACIKRWPITSLHPFGTLVEQLGEMGEVKIETDAVLRDNNFGPDEFADAVVRSVQLDDWNLETEDKEALATRKDFRDEKVFTIVTENGGSSDSAYHVKDLGDGTLEVGVHVADVGHFIKPNSLVDREARKRGTGVYLVNRTVPLLPTKLADDILSLNAGNERLAMSIVFHIDKETGEVKADKTWAGKSIVKSTANVPFETVDKVVEGGDGELDAELKSSIEALQVCSFRLFYIGNC